MKKKYREQDARCRKNRGKVRSVFYGRRFRCKCGGRVAIKDEKVKRAKVCERRDCHSRF